MSKEGSIDPNEGIEPGKRLIRLEGDRGLSLTERLSNHLHRLAWRTPLHSLRLRGRYPLKLLAVPVDPLPGNPDAGRAILTGRIDMRGDSIDIAGIDFHHLSVTPALAEHLQSFAWLRDLGAAATREQAAPVAERVVGAWLSAFGSMVTAAAWRPDLCALRILNWTANAPMILSSSDLVYRSAVLNAIARHARHLDRGADKAPQGLARITAWVGVVAAGLLIPGGEIRRFNGEAGLIRALSLSLGSDGGLADRSPRSQLQLIEVLSMLRQVYAVRRIDWPDAVQQALARAVPALLGVTMGDGGLSSWQGGGPVGAARVEAAILGSSIRARPLRQATDWGYQRLHCAQTRVILDAAPPPITKLSAGGCASTLAIELSDGPHRLIVNCGGSSEPAKGFPEGLADALRTTAAHSVLVVDDSNSTATYADGSLGKGVSEVELDRQEIDAGSRIEASHDGYVRRYGFVHRRSLLLSSDGREVRGDDVLLPAGRRRRSQAVPIALRFHLAPGTEVTLTADGQGALLRIEGGALWQFRGRGGSLTVEDSLWVDESGWPRATEQLVVNAEAPSGGASLSWVLRRAG